MNKVIYTYALIKSFSQHDRDYLDSFWPLVLKVIPDSQKYSADKIKEELKNKYYLDIPSHVLDSILKRAKRQSLLETSKDGRMYNLLDKAKKEISKFEDESIINSQIEQFIDDIKLFLSKNNSFIEKEKILDIVLKFLNNNIFPLMQLFDPDEKYYPDYIYSESRQSEILFIEYIRVIEKENPKMYEVFKKMMYGSIISSLLYVKDKSKIDGIKQGFSNCSIYLDTNYIISVLGLDAKEFSEPASELLEILKKKDFKIKVFRFTISEICNLINGYNANSYKYPSNIKIGNFYSNLKIMGWDSFRAKDFIINIEEYLKNKGIEIDYAFDYDIKNYQPQNKNIKESMRKYKENASEYTLNHDTAAIESIQKLRKHTTTRIEDCGVVFITSDIQLARMDYQELGHKENGTVCEIIQDKLLTNIIWLKDPGIELSLNTIISLHSKELFIAKEVWEKFYNVLHNLVLDKEINQYQVSSLFYHNYIEDVLIGVNASESDNITKEFVLAEIEKASRRLENKNKNDILKIKEELQIEHNEFLNVLKEKSSSEIVTNSRKWLDKIETIKNDELKQSEKKSKRYVRYIKEMLLLGLVVAMYLVVNILGKNIKSILQYSGFVSLLILLLGIRVVDCWIELEKIIEKKIYLKKIKHLTELEKLADLSNK